MRDVVSAAERVREGVDCGAAGGAEGYAGVVRGEQEVAEQRDARFAALVRYRFVMSYYHLRGLVGEQLGKFRRLRRERGLDGVDERVYRAGGEHLEGQAVQQFRDKRTLVGEERGGDEPHLRAEARSIDYRDVRHLAAGAAGRRRYDEAAAALDVRRGRVELVGRVSAGDGDGLRYVYYRAAASRDEAPEAELRCRRDYFVGHHVGRLAAAEVLPEERLDRQAERREVRLVYRPYRKEQVIRAERELARELRAGFKFMYLRVEHYFPHKAAPPSSLRQL